MTLKNGPTAGLIGLSWVTHAFYSSSAECHWRETDLRILILRRQQTPGIHLRCRYFFCCITSFNNLFSRYLYLYPGKHLINNTMWFVLWGCYCSRFLCRSILLIPLFRHKNFVEDFLWPRRFLLLNLRLNFGLNWAILVCFFEDFMFFLLFLFVSDSFEKLEYWPKIILFYFFVHVAELGPLPFPVGVDVRIGAATFVLGAAYVTFWRTRFSGDNFLYYFVMIHILL